MIDVLIVGYGPTGETLATLLGRAGLRVVVLERSADAYPLPRAVHLDAEAMRVFQACGLGDAVERIAAPSLGMDYVDVDGQTVFTYEPFRRPPLLGWEQDYMIFQPALDALLREAAARLPTVEARLGAEVMRVQQHAHGVTAHLAGGETLEAHWLVACDGATSTVRRRMQVGVEDLGYHERWLVVDVELRRPVALPDRVQQICDPRRPATFIPGAVRHRRWELMALAGEDNAALEDPARVWELLAPWLGPRDATLVRARTYWFHALAAERFRHGRVFLAGDAAHQMPPFMGQGLCSGIRDAANLAWKLEAVLHGAREELLDTYESERRPHVLETIRLSVESGRLIERIATAGVQVLPPAAPVDPAEWSRLPHLAAGALHPPANPPAPIGRQAHQPFVVTADGRRVRLDDVCGSGFALLTRRHATARDLSVLPFATVTAQRVGDPDGGLDRLLGPHEALVLRPDRYVFGAAHDERQLDEVLDSLHRWVGAHDAIGARA